MILLDTNVFSEPIKPNPELRVAYWLDEQAVETLYLPSTGLAEILVGIERLPAGKRKRDLREAVDLLLKTFIGPRVLPFDDLAAQTYSVLVAEANIRGKVISLGDGQIGSIAQVHGFIVATRDTKPFLAMGLKVINPWESK